MKAFCFIWLAVFVCACGPAPGSIDTKTGYQAEVAEVMLKDGTRCAVLVGMSGRGGISCDWR